MKKKFSNQTSGQCFVKCVTQKTCYYRESAKDDYLELLGKKVIMWERKINTAVR